ncbi:MAG: uroporphyrinogen decarboxylase family protein [Planctomycetota bacterium]
MDRTANCLKKLERMNKTLRHEEADRVPVSDFFWGSFLERWRKDLKLPPDTDIYRHYDLDWIVTIPNMDPHIKSFEILRQDSEEVVVKTGYEAVVRKKLEFPMPEFVSWDTDSIERLESFEFDDAYDRRRYFEAGDNQIAGVGDGFERNSPAWIETVKQLRPHFPVFGSIGECSECLTRLVGQANTLLWIGMYPERIGKAINRIAEFYLECTKAQIEAANGLIDGMVIWGDVAYTKAMLFSPDYWREYFKPCVKAMADVCHQHKLPVIYHGCGNVSSILGDFIEVGVDALNPLEAKTGLDVVELRRKFGHRLGFCGNMDVMTWADATEKQLKEAVLRKLNAAKGGGYIFQSDHSVPGNISGQNYDYVVKLVREYGKYPLQLGESDIPELG